MGRLRDFGAHGVDGRGHDSFTAVGSMTSSFFVATVATVTLLACGGGGSSETSGRSTTSAGSADVGVAVTEPNEPGEAGCATADECTLTDWRCSPCDTCPNVRSRALLSASLEAARATCEWTNYTGPEPECERCPDPDPTFRQWTSVACVDGTCVAHALGPTDAESLSGEPPSP